jgi:hypothetical protein
MTGETLMAQRNLSGKNRRERVVVNSLWLAAGAIFVAGAALRVIASLVARDDVRLGGVALLAAGTVLGVIAWASERYLLPRAS